MSLHKSRNQSSTRTRPRLSRLGAYLHLLCRFADDEPTLDDYTAPQGSTKPAVGSSAIYRSTKTDEETERLSQGMTLFLAARDRVLTLSEQRVSPSDYLNTPCADVGACVQILGPLIPQLTSTPLITSHDLPPLIAHNPTLAHPILTALLAQPLIDTYLDVLRHLPPTLPTFDLLGRLLRDPTAVVDRTTGGRTTIADLVRSDVLGWFLHESMLWLDKAQEEEQAGAISDDRFAKGVQNVRCPCLCNSSCGSSFPYIALPLLQLAHQA